MHKQKRFFQRRYLIDNNYFGHENLNFEKFNLQHLNILNSKCIILFCTIIVLCTSITIYLVIILFYENTNSVLITNEDKAQN